MTTYPPPGPNELFSKLQHSLILTLAGKYYALFSRILCKMFTKSLMNTYFHLMVEYNKTRNSWQFCGLKIIYYWGDFLYFDCLFSINGNFNKNLCPLFCRFPLFWHPLLGGFTVSLLWSLISSPFRPLWKQGFKRENKLGHILYHL